MANFTLTAGIDTFTGTAGELNRFFFVPANLQPTDTITGGATGGFVDILSVTAGGTITAGQFAGVTNVEELDSVVIRQFRDADQRTRFGQQPRQLQRPRSRRRQRRRCRAASPTTSITFTDGLGQRYAHGRYRQRRLLFSSGGFDLGDTVYRRQRFRLSSSCPRPVRLLVPHLPTFRTSKQWCLADQAIP